MARVSLFADNRFNVERHAYCLCLHVRPVTIFLALINLGGSLICACFTLFLMINGFKSNYSSYYPSHLYRDEFSRFDGISILMYLLLTLVSAMLLYGVLKSKPSYILPFFGIQFIDYLFTIPQYLASIYTRPYQHYYLAKAKEQLDIYDQDKNSYADSNSWSSTDKTATSNNVYTVSLLFMTIILIFKTYFLCAVWKCYRYLHMKEFILPLTLHNSNLTNEGIIPVVITQGNLPPPDYEEATKLPDYMPPDYQTVVLNNPKTETGNEEIATINQQTQSKTNIKQI